GVLARATTESDHWLAAGVQDRLHVLVTGNDIYTPVRRDEADTVARFAAPEDVLASGVLWEENRKQLAFKPFVVSKRSGRGLVIGFTADPNFRAHMAGLNLIFMNAIFRGAAMTHEASRY
ncbi:MAG: peptidase M14, partial [Steroidobacteraceae bacterium]